MHSSSKNEADFSQLINNAKVYMSNTAKGFSTKSQSYQNLQPQKYQASGSSQQLGGGAQFSTSQIYKQLVATGEKDNTGLFKSERLSKNSDAYEQL